MRATRRWMIRCLTTLPALLITVAAFAQKPGELAPRGVSLSRAQKATITRHIRQGVYMVAPDLHRYLAHASSVNVPQGGLAPDTKIALTRPSMLVSRPGSTNALRMLVPFQAREGSALVMGRAYVSIDRATHRTRTDKVVVDDVLATMRSYMHKNGHAAIRQSNGKFTDITLWKNKK